MFNDVHMGVEFSPLGKLTKVKKAKMAATESWKPTYSHIFVTRQDTNMIKLFLYVFKYEDFDVICLNKYIKITVIYVWDSIDNVVNAAKNDWLEINK